MNLATPNSLRLIVVVAPNPTFASPLRPWPALLSVTSSTTGLVTSRMVRSPVTLSLSPAPFSTLVLLNVAVGHFAASKKSALWMCLVRSGTSASRPDSGSVTFTLEASTLSASYTSVPSTLPKFAIGLE
jgi:hypothetical protein